MKKLIIKKNDRTYIIDNWNIKCDLDKNEKPFSLISGMDNFGMFFQIKTNHLVKPEEKEEEFLLVLG